MVISHMQQGKVSQVFKAASHAAGLLLKAGAVYGGLLAIPLYTLKAEAPAAVEPPKFSMAMDGFQNYATSLTGWTPFQTADAKRYLAIYEKEHAEFLTAVAACRNDPTHCPENLALVITAAQNISRIQDPAIQVAETQAFVELMLRFDRPEAYSPVHHYSFLTGIGHRYGVCAQKAFLKFAILEMAGFPQSMTQLVFEIVKLGETKIAMSHVTVEVSLNGQHMMMDDREDMAVDEPLDMADIWNLAVKGSFMMSDRNQTNRTARNPYINTQLAVLTPSVSVNAKGAGIFKPIDNLDEGSATTIEEGFDLTVQSIDLRQITCYPGEQTALTEILLPAIAANYIIKPRPRMELSQR